MPFYGQDVWDPALIVGQMVMMQVRRRVAASPGTTDRSAAQCLHYLFFGMFMGVSSFLFGLPLTMAEFFDPSALHFDGVHGLCVAASWLLTAAVGCAPSPLAVAQRQAQPPFPWSLRRPERYPSWRSSSAPRSAGTLGSPSSSGTPPRAA